MRTLSVPSIALFLVASFALAGAAGARKHHPKPHPQLLIAFRAVYGVDGPFVGGANPVGIARATKGPHAAAAAHVTISRELPLRKPWIARSRGVAFASIRQVIEQSVIGRNRERSEEHVVAVAKRGDATQVVLPVRVYRPALRHAARTALEGRRFDPARPGYEVRAWSEPGCFNTHWTHCAPLGFVKRYVERHGDRGEIEAFYHSWCLYDWPAADVLAGGAAGQHGHYRRLHTLSRGDSICDMCWSAAALRA